MKFMGQNAGRNGSVSLPASRGMAARIRQAATHTPSDTKASIQARAAPRYALLIRAAKLIVNDRELLCLLRDISASGARVQFFQSVPRDAEFAIEFDDGERIVADLVWQDKNEGGFHFRTMIDVARRLAWESDLPKRALRFSLDCAAQLHTAAGSHAAVFRNLSKQGGLIECEAPLAIDQPVRLSAPNLGDIEARIRWRDRGRTDASTSSRHSYGLVFDTTFSMEQLGQLLHRIS
ncbi:MAG: PilZ domain-containing protein [Pontixanthobacter sp.]